MADNVEADPGTGGAVFATDEAAGIHHPYAKIEWGANNTQTPVDSGASALPIQDGGNTITVDGSVTVTQATAANLNVTEASAAAIAASLSVLDDWDESDRAKVNIIAGQAGIAGGTGVDGATVPRVTLATNVALPAGSNAIGKLAANSGVDIGDVDVTSVAGNVTVINAGTFAVQVDGSALTALQLIDDPVVQDDNGFTPGTTKVMMAGFQADETATDSVDEGDGGAARMTLTRKVIVTPQPHTAGGLSIFRSLDLDESEEEVKGSAGQVYGVWVTNTATTTRFLKFYNGTAANVVVGSSTPVITIGIPGNTSDDISAVLGAGGMGLAFDTAITVAATTGLADADTGAPAGNDVVVNIFYA